VDDQCPGSAKPGTEVALNSCVKSLSGLDFLIKWMLDLNTMDNRLNNGVLEEFRLEFIECWHRLPNKGFFLGLVAAWLTLFHFLGNSTLGYIATSTPSLLIWMFNIWRSGGLLESDDAFGFFMPFIVLGLFWMKRRQLLSLNLGLWWPGIFLVALALGCHVLGFMVQQPRLSVVALFLGLYGLTGLAWGAAWLRASAFPFFLLAFCVPMGVLAERFTFALRMLVSQLVVLVSHFILAIDVERDGTILMDATRRYQYEVAAACSGIRSLLATLALAMILAFVSFRKPWKRLLVIGSAFPLAVLGNLLRMLAIVIAAEIGGQALGNQVHDGGPFGIYSLLPYVPVFAGLVLLERYFGDQPGVLSTPALKEQRA
jgi:exosortase